MIFIIIPFYKIELILRVVQNDILLTQDPIPFSFSTTSFGLLPWSRPRKQKQRQKSGFGRLCIYGQRFVSSLLSNWLLNAMGALGLILVTSDEVRFTLWS